MRPQYQTPELLAFLFYYSSKTINNSLKNFKSMKPDVHFSITFKEYSHCPIARQNHVDSACVVLTCSIGGFSSSSAVQTRVSSDFFPTLRWWNESRPRIDWRWKQTILNKTSTVTLICLFCIVSASLSRLHNFSF